MRIKRLSPRIPARPGTGSINDINKEKSENKYPRIFIKRAVPDVRLLYRSVSFVLNNKALKSFPIQRPWYPDSTSLFRSQPIALARKGKKGQVKSERKRPGCNSLPFAQLFQ